MIISTYYHIRFIYYTYNISIKVVYTVIFLLAFGVNTDLLFNFLGPVHFAAFTDEYQNEFWKKIVDLCCGDKHRWFSCLKNYKGINCYSLSLPEGAIQKIYNFLHMKVSTSWAKIMVSCVLLLRDSILTVKL